MYNFYRDKCSLYRTGDNRVLYARIKMDFDLENSFSMIDLKLDKRIIERYKKSRAS